MHVLSNAFLQDARKNIMPHNIGMSSKRSELRDWLRHLIEIYGSAEAIARRAGVASTTITRFLKRPDSAPFPGSATIEKIETGTGESFSAFCLGEDRPRNDFEREALNALANVPADDREAVLRTIRAFSRK